MSRWVCCLLLTGCAFTSEDFQVDLHTTLCEQGTTCASWEEQAYCGLGEDAVHDYEADGCTFDDEKAADCLDGEFVCEAGFLDRPAACDAVYAGCNAPPL